MTLPEAIEAAGYGITGDIGGIRKKVYYTPDGRKILAVPCIRTWVRKDEKGKVVDTGERDANYDKGWLERPPENPKLYCRGCDRWHDTQEEIDACIASKDRLIKSMERKTRKEVTNESEEKDKEIHALNERINRLEKIIENLGAKVG